MTVRASGRSRRLSIGQRSRSIVARTPIDISAGRVILPAFRATWASLQGSRTLVIRGDLGLRTGGSEYRSLPWDPPP